MPYLPDLSLEEALMDMGSALVFTSDRESNVRLFRELMRRRCQQIAKKASVKIKTEPALTDASSDKQASGEDAEVREKSPQPKKRFKIESSSSVERSKENIADTNTSDLLRAANVYRNQDDDDDELEVVSSWRPTARGSKAMSLTQDKQSLQIAQQQIKNASSSSQSTEAPSSSKSLTAQSFTLLMQDTKIKKSKPLKLLCSICGTQSIDPCAGRCGHVCCSACWVP